jgi:hypothetical protein
VSGYPDAETNLRTLAARWRELEAALDTLAGQLAADSDPRAAAAAALRAQANAEAAAVEGVAANVRNLLTADDALIQARATFDGSRVVAQVVNVNFEVGGAFPPDPTDRVEIVLCRDLVTRLLDVIIEVLGELDSVIEPLGPPFNIRGIRRGVEDISAYPLLVSDGLDHPPAAYGGAAGTAILQRTVDASLRQTLGRLPKYTDSRAFLAALNQSFAVKEVDGRTMVSWRARSYVGQTELGGGVTGFQASVYARARDALSLADPLLESLSPLLPDADPEEMAAARSIVRTQFAALVDELGVEGGPRPLRVDELFRVLLEQQVVGLENVPIEGGMIGYLGHVYGLRRELVNTVDEERSFSDFLLLRDYVLTTQTSWFEFRDNQLGGDLGTRLVLLSNALQVVAESVDEVEAAMDSVYVGPAERTIAVFATDPDGGTMLVSELLSWIASFTTDEAPQLVQDGGRRGVGTIISTARRLEGLVDRLLDALTGDPRLPAGLRHPRVRHPLSEVRTYLSRVAELASQVHQA